MDYESVNKLGYFEYPVAATLQYETTDGSLCPAILIRPPMRMYNEEECTKTIAWYTTHMESLDIKPEILPKAIEEVTGYLQKYREGERLDR